MKVFVKRIKLYLTSKIESASQRIENSFNLKILFLKFKSGHAPIVRPKKVTVLDVSAAFDPNDKTHCRNVYDFGIKGKYLI